MKIILFHTNFRSMLSIIISIFTFSKYSHGAVVCDGAVYDAIQRGFYCAGRIKDFTEDRRITVIDLPDVNSDLLYKEILKMQEKSVKYDESTIIRFLKNDKKENKFYCFEAVCFMLKSVGYNVDLSKRLTSNDILRIIKQKKYSIEYTGRPRDL